MTPGRLLEHFEQIGEAPGAVARLRRFILDLAVRGKLVEQDPADEPAAVLLERIEAWRKDAICKKHIRPPRKPLKPIESHEYPYQLPIGWSWARLGEIIYIQSGVGLTSSKMKEGDIPVFGGNGVTGYHDAANVEQPTIVIGRVGYYCGSIHVTPSKAWVTDNAFITKYSAKEIFQDFLFLLLKATNLKENESATAQPVISGSKIYPIVLGIPPLLEQHRIVAKVDELMVLCDELEATQTEREQRRDRLVAATLHGLNNPEDDSGDGRSFQDTARFYFNHLPRLSTRPEHVQQLRQTILNVAVRGRLVKQEKSQQSVSESSGKSVDTKQNETEEQFSIPESWIWVAVGDIASCRLGKMLDKAKNKGTPRRYLRNVNVRWFDFDLTDVSEMRFEDDELEVFALKTGDVLICEGGEPGRAAIWDSRESEIYFQKALHRVRFQQSVKPEFFLYALRESVHSGRLSTYFTGIGIKHFTGKGLTKFVFPLPPLAEQHRIVAKVDELMALCDELETHLTGTDTARGRLLEATLQEALHGGAAAAELRKAG